MFKPLPTTHRWDSLAKVHQLFHTTKYFSLKSIKRLKIISGMDRSDLGTQEIVADYFHKQSAT